MMTDKEMLAVAANQSAEDIGCKADDFFMDKNIAVPFKLGADAKKYYSLPIAANFISYGNNVVAAATDDCFDTVKEYINTFDFYHCFETPNLYWLNKRLEPKGYTVCFMAEYFLPNLNQLKELPCKYEFKVLEQKDFAKLYLPEWSNALCADRKELDVLGVGAYDEGRLIGLAGCSADAKDMLQIGVDVLPEYRRGGVASALTSRLATEILKRDKVPFYCCAWSNIRSAKNAIRSGFSLAWAEMTVKPLEAVNEMNEKKKNAV